MDGKKRPEDPEFGENVINTESAYQNVWLRAFKVGASTTKVYLPTLEHKFPNLFGLPPLFQIKNYSAPTEGNAALEG